MKTPTFGNGKICYLEIPSIDISQSAAFYKKVFNWMIRENSDGSLSFDDGVGEVSGMWVTNRQPGTGAGIMISIMVADIAKTILLIKENGGSIPEGYADPSGKTRLFQDPSGNAFCLYESSSAK
jgi:predicted enzyme related to lactoylglutathione lyase